MVQEKIYVILDSDDNRRAEMYRTFAATWAALPIASLQDLGSVWPANAWFFVHDDDQLISALHRGFAERGCFHPIVVYSERLVPSRIVSAIYGGAINYVIWPDDLAAIERSNERVADIARHRCEHATARFRAQSRVASLSTREAEVIREVRRGLTNKEIARTLEISPRTVEIHRANALAKLGARNSADATRILVEAEVGITPFVIAA